MTCWKLVFFQSEISEIDRNLKNAKSEN